MRFWGDKSLPLPHKPPCTSASGGKPVYTVWSWSFSALEPLNPGTRLSCDFPTSCSTLHRFTFVSHKLSLSRPRGDFNLDWKSQLRSNLKIGARLTICKCETPLVFNPASTPRFLCCETACGEVIISQRKILILDCREVLCVKPTVHLRWIC